MKTWLVSPWSGDLPWLSHLNLFSILQTEEMSICYRSCEFSLNEARPLFSRGQHSIERGRQWTAKGATAGIVRLKWPRGKQPGQGARAAWCCPTWKVLSEAMEQSRSRVLGRSPQRQSQQRVKRLVNWGVKKLSKKEAKNGACICQTKEAVWILIWMWLGTNFGWHFGKTTVVPLHRQTMKPQQYN